VAERTLEKGMTGGYRRKREFLEKRTEKREQGGEREKGIRKKAY